MANLKDRIEFVKKMFPKGDTALIAALHEVQTEYGWLHPEGINLIKETLGYSEDQIMSVASFYHMFHKEPPGKYHIHLCTNLTCMQEGAYKLLKFLRENLKEGNEEFTYEEVECIGLCDKAPAALINGEPVIELTEEKLNEILKSPEKFVKGYKATYYDMREVYDKEGSDSK